MRANLLIGMIFLFVTLTGAGCNQMQQMTGPSIRGDYVLVYRELPDGRQLRSPEVGGMFTLTKDMRNFNVYWMENGKPASLATISHYTLTDKRYSEHCMYYMQNIPSAGGLKYETTETTGSADVTMSDGKTVMKLPLHDEPEVVFTHDGMTATRLGAFVDHWKKVG